MIIQLSDSSDWEASFECPEGIFTANLSEFYAVPSKKDKTKRAYKFVFLAFDESTNKYYKVGKEFEQDKSGRSKLTKFLADWLGKDFVRRMGKELDPENLIGTPADIVTKHHDNPNHPFPYVELIEVQPAGYLTGVKKAA